MLGRLLVPRTAPSYTLDDIASDPKKYERLLGIKVPSFDEFKKNPEKYKISPLANLIAVEEGLVQIRHLVRKQYYFIAGEKVPSLEKVESRAKELGWELSDLEIKPELNKATNGGVDVHVHFVQKRRLLAP